RIGVTWGIRDDLTLRGGVGLYSGGNPNVWISNAWSNDGLTNAQFQFNYFDSATVLPGFADSLPLSRQQRPGYDVPQEMVDAVLAVTPADANTSNLVIIDPDYEQPSEWKFALGGTWDMPWLGGMQLDFDYLHSRGNDPAYYVDLSQSIVGTTILGTPIYDFTNGRDNLMLTNSGETPVSNVISFVLRKEFDFGLDVLVGYAWTEAEDVSPMTSAVAVSNFDNTALLDINNPPAANSNYVVPQRWTLRLDYEYPLFGDNLTQVTLFGFFNEGQPQSYAMNSSDLEGDGFFGRHLLYIPDGPSDPNVVFGADFDQQAFFEWAAANGLGPGFTERNGYNTGWSSRFDLRISQEIPLPADLVGRLYFKVYNLGNMLNDNWGEIVDAQFFTPEIVDASVDAQGRFVFEDFSDRSIERTYINRSLWEARIGFDIKFGL
ncbi:MAG TPA: hypothetical protein VLS87_00360, partial [Woeseiaceae bacterium]|nr:hypothetical protein [Woeseiaceae bacterium]